MNMMCSASALLEKLVDASIDMASGIYAPEDASPRCSLRCHPTFTKRTPTETPATGHMDLRASGNGRISARNDGVDSRLS